VILNDLYGATMKFDQGTPERPWPGLRNFHRPNHSRLAAEAGFLLQKGLIKLLRPRKPVWGKERGNRLSAVRF
jgi:hypothetical protein